MRPQLSLTFAAALLAAKPAERTRSVPPTRQYHMRSRFRPRHAARKARVTRVSRFVVVSTLLALSPLTGEAGGVKVTSFGSLAGGNAAFFNDVTKAMGAIEGTLGIPLADGVKVKFFGSLAGGNAVSSHDLTKATGAIESTLDIPLIGVYAAPGGMIYSPPVTPKLWEKLLNLHDFFTPLYSLRPVCPAPLPQCCFPCCPYPRCCFPPCPPRPCPDSLPFGELSGKSVPRWGHLVNDAMWNLAAQYEGFRNEYIASGSDKLEQRLQMKGLKGAWDRFPD